MASGSRFIFCACICMITFPAQLSHGVIFDDVINYLERMNIIPDSLVNMPKNSSVLPEARMTTSEILTYYGFAVETHAITTPDGYILEIHRIPTNFTSGDGPRQPVILQHGVQCSSGSWVANGLQDSLGFVLARAGFDVWLTNVRGNQYGRNHVSESPELAKFWKFNIDHFALIDLPTTIDYILRVTGQSKLNYVGHSMGATMIAALLSDKPQYNKKIRLILMLAPVFFERYVRSPLRLLHVYMEEVTALWNELKKTDEILRSSIWQKHLIQNLCKSYPGVILCEIFFYVLFGYDEVLNNRQRMHVYLSHCPAGTSFQVFFHFAQTFRANRFRHFDYGPKQNKRIYNQKQPPDYNLNNVKPPVAIFWSYMDHLVDQKDVYQLAKRLPNVYLLEQVPFDLFAHQDFQFGHNTTALLYNQVVTVLQTTDEKLFMRAGLKRDDFCGL